MIGSDLLRYDKKRKYLAWDLETTGLNLGYALPWQLSFSVFTLDKVIEEHDHYIYWDNLPMSKDAARITRFDWERYKQFGRDPKEILDLFEERLMDPEIYSVGQNQLSYDNMIHALWRRKLGLGDDYSYLGRAYDTVAIAKAWKKGFSIDRNNLLAWQYRMMDYVERGLKTNLAQLGRDLEVPFDPDKLHDALEDIRLLRGVWRKIIWKVEI